MIPPSTPIEEATERLGLRVSLPSHVRTAGDLIVALERGEVEVDAKTARKFALLNWTDSPAFLESLERNLEGLRTLSKPGATFTKEQRAKIDALVGADDDEAAAKKIRGLLP